jgi:hypothetical protein
VGAGVALSTGLGYLAYAVPGGAIDFIGWLADPFTFSGPLWVVLGALIGFSALQFLRGRRPDRHGRQFKGKGEGESEPTR